MKTIQVCDEGDTIPDISERIVEALDLEFGLSAEKTSSYEKMLQESSHGGKARPRREEMARIVRKEIINFLFRE